MSDSSPTSFVSINSERAICNRYIVNATYSEAKDAKYVNVPPYGNVWVVDCGAEINMTFKIGGQSYPIHPLDVTREDKDPNGESFCFGTVRMTSPQRSVR